MIAPGSSISGATLQGRAVGALVLTSFGTIWMGLGARCVRGMNWRLWLVIAAVAAILSTIAIKHLNARQNASNGDSATLLQSRSGPALPSEHRGSEQFKIILWLEWIPIVGIVLLLNWKAKPELIMPAIALVVGLHFIPLARIFHLPLYYFTAAVMIAITVTAFLSEDPVRRQAIVGIGCGSTLWLTALSLLV